MDAQGARSPSEVLALMDARADEFGDRLALSIREEGQSFSLSYADLRSRARALASLLIESGTRDTDRLAILAESRPEWAIALFASIRAGGILVPLDCKLTDPELSAILGDCAPSVLFVSSAQRKRVATLRVPDSCRIVPLQGEDGEQGFSSIADESPGSPAPPRARSTDETAVLVYTSGSLGRPKGVMITFANLLFQINNLRSVVDLGPGDHVVSVLPLNHLLELTTGLLCTLNRGATIVYCRSLFPRELIELIGETHARLIVGVPTLYRLLKRHLEAHVPRGSVPAFREIFGGRPPVFISGGAPLDLETETFFDDVGLRVLQGYGMTETSPVISMNTQTAYRPGSVGRPIPGVEVRIEGGEILTRGPHVMKGYHNQEELTRQAIDSDGWLHTGDIGRLDEDGFLYVTGRSKTLIVLGGGKKVQPEEVELVLIRSPRIREVCVLGRTSARKTEEVCAIVVTEEPCTEEELQAEIDDLAQNIAAYKRPSRLFAYPGELPRTASGKVKRGDVRAWLHEQEAKHAE